MKRCLVVTNYKFKVPQEELDKFKPYVDQALEDKSEMALIRLVTSWFPMGNDYYKVVDYTLDSYNRLTKCMRKWEAKENSLYNGIELILINHFSEKNEDE